MNKRRRANRDTVYCSPIRNSSQPIRHSTEEPPIPINLQPMSSRLMTKQRFRFFTLMTHWLAPFAAFAADVPAQLPKPDGKAAEHTKPIKVYVMLGQSNMLGEGIGPAGSGVIFRNINIEDPRPTLQQFFLCMTMPSPYSKDGEKRESGDLSGIFFQNISIAAPSVLSEPQLFWGQADARICDLTFENLTVGGKPVCESSSSRRTSSSTR